MAGRAHPDYEADVVKVSAIICSLLNPFNAGIATSNFSPFLMNEKGGAGILGDREFERLMRNELASSPDYDHPSLSSFKEGAENIDEVTQNLNSRAQLIGISSGRNRCV